METKICEKCNTEKEISLFYNNKGCIDCRKKYMKDYVAKNREVLLKKKRTQSKVYYLNNTKKIKEYREIRKNEMSLYCKLRYTKKKEEIKEKIKIYVSKNKEKIRTTKKKYQEKNKEKLKIARAEYFQNNKNKIYQQKKIALKKRRERDSLYKLQCNLRKRTWDAFSKLSYKKNGTTEQLLGATPLQIKIHIESKFKENMTWSNYGEWHIDHKIPLASAKTEQDLIDLCHYTNLQPLWALENLVKGANMPTS